MRIYKNYTSTLTIVLRHSHARIVVNTYKIMQLFDKIRCCN